MLWFYIAKFSSRIYRYVYVRYGIALRGLGFILRHIDEDRVIEVSGQKMYLNHKVASCYELLIDGHYNEPETHKFFALLMGRLEFPVMFVDVGANVGEMITDFARYERVTSIVGFEPYPECANACRATVELNGHKKTSIVEKVLSDRAGSSQFTFSQESPGASSLRSVDAAGASIVRTSTLDLELDDRSSPAILLIDVEGAEPLVLAGGKEFIAANRPLIIFEFNSLSRKYFTLDEISRILGPSYEIFRLRQDGNLDRDLSNTWNCVAIHDGSKFYQPLQAMILQ